MTSDFDHRAFDALMNKDPLDKKRESEISTPSTNRTAGGNWQESMKKAPKYNTTTGNISKLNAPEADQQMKLSPAVQELINRRKHLLQKLWDDLDESWMHRETFLHQAFSSPYDNFSLISNETLRLFEIRWLDLRVQGLIEQRETCLKRIADISEKRNPRDMKKNQKLIEEDLVLFRTLSLYITEYIQTWMSKRPDRQSYLWKGKDYLLHMNSDFTKLARKSKRIQTILEECKLSIGPLCLPKYPQLYYKYVADKLKKEQEIFDPKPQSDLEQTAKTPSSMHAPDQQSVKFTDVPSSPSAFHTPQNLNAFAQSNQFGKVLKFQKKLNLDNWKEIENEMGTTRSSKSFITGLEGNLLKSVKFSDMKPPKTEKLPDDVDPAHLPPLLIDQSFKERRKRHKKYSEPLCTIRHEDLMERMQEEQPWFIAEALGKKKSNDGPKAVANSQLAHIQQVIGKTNNYLKKMQEQRPDFQIPKGFNVNTNIIQDPLEDLDDKDVEFPDANLAEDVDRLRRAQKFIADHGSNVVTSFSEPNSSPATPLKNSRTHAVGEKNKLNIT